MMNYWMINVGLTFLLCVFFAGIVIPQILLIAFRKKLFDMPDERKIHTSAVPRLGGIAFKPVIFFSVALMVGVNLSLGHSEIVTSSKGDILQLAYGFCALMVIYLVGIADDLIGVRYRAKFIAQVCCAIMLIAGGLCIDDLHGVFGLHALPFVVMVPFTVLVVVFIINAINLIDGIDGLASGLSSVTFIFYGVSFFLLKEYVYSILAFATLGVLVPFFYYNVFGKAEKQQKIFMGDTGSLTIGMMTCFLSLKLLQAAPDNADVSVNPMVLAFSPLIIPCFDVIRVYFHRVRNGKNPFLPDKNHIHHKLLAIGMKQRCAMVSIVLFSILFTAGNIFFSDVMNVNVLLLLDLFLWTVLNVFLTRKIKSQNL